MLLILGPLVLLNKCIHDLLSNHVCVHSNSYYIAMNTYSNILIFIACLMTLSKKVQTYYLSLRIISCKLEELSVWNLHDHVYVTDYSCGSFAIFSSVSK